MHPRTLDTPSAFLIFFAGLFSNSNSVFPIHPLPSPDLGFLLLSGGGRPTSHLLLGSFVTLIHSYELKYN